MNRRVGRLKVMDIVVIVVTVLLVGGGLLYRVQSSTEKAQLCSAPGTVHRVMVSQDAFVPAELTVKRCDQIRIDNNGRQNYDFAFGSHEDHIDYSGFTRQLLAPDEYFIFDAFQVGDYVLHDHLRDKAKIRLTIYDPQFLVTQ